MISYFILQLIASAGVNAALSGFIIWITKSWISERLAQSIKNEYDQKLETHKAQLKAGSDIEIEKLKCELNISANEHQVRFARLYEKRAEVIAETYALLKELYTCLASYVKPFESVGDTPREERRKEAHEALTRFKSYYATKLIFIPGEIASKLEEIDKELVGAFNEFYLGVERVQASGGDGVAKWIEIVGRVNEEINAALRGLETEFRKLVGDES